jgi:hypothetical protein
MSDAGGSLGITSAQITLADSATGNLPDESQISSGDFRPTDYQTGDPFPNTPAGATSANLAAFVGTNPNGDWRIFVVDDTAGNRGGIIESGALLSIRTTPTITPIPNQVTDEDVTLRMTVTIGDNQPGVPLDVRVEPDNTTLVPTNNIVISGSGATRTISITP